MTLPSSAVETNCFIYINKEDAPTIEASSEFTPIRGQHPDLHGIVIGYIKGKLVIINRVF